MSLTIFLIFDDLVDLWIVYRWRLRKEKCAYMESDIFLEGSSLVGQKIGVSEN